MRALILILVGACSLNVDYTGTYYQCDPDGACPDGFSCQSQVCVPDQPAPPACSAHVTAGGGHSCAIRNDGSVWCWGQNDFGQLGDGTATDNSIPVQVIDTANAPVKNMVSLGAGDASTCALDNTGAVFCWGHNNNGQLGQGMSDSRTAVQVPGISGATQIAVGVQHACALLGDKSITCWGDNRDGELGDGSKASHAPMVVPTLSGITYVSAGDSTTCAVETAGTVKCWGNNEGGQLGNGNQTGQTTPVAVAEIAGATEVLAGQGFSCAAMPGLVKCWGSGALGNGFDPYTNQSNTPVVVNAPVGLTHLTGGNQTACGIDDRAQLWCWGLNGDDRIGDGSYQNQRNPIRSQLVDVVEASTNGNHTCAVDKRGAIRCAGFNRRGELGDGKRLTQGAPQKVPNLTDVMSLVAGGSHTCALTKSGDVKCWGANDAGQLGIGNTSNSSIPHGVVGVAAVTELSASGDETCALIETAAYCWGSNGSGQLHNNTQSNATVPLLLHDFGPITHINAGDNNTCAIVNGQAVCVGSFSATPQPFGPSGAVAVATASNHGCVITSDKVVHCTANKNDVGQLGNGTTMCCTDSTPVSNATALTLRGGESCALQADGTVKCWGFNNGSHLGVGDSQYLITSPASQPVPATQVSLGYNIGCSLRSDGGGVACWGSNYYGGVGDGTYGDHNAPTTVAGTSTATQVVAGANHACALMGDGTVTCWGNDSEGELGDGVVFNQDPSGVKMTCP